MNRAEIRENLDRIDALALEIGQHIPAAQGALTGFRSDLAGLLVVLICAAYENCIKEILNSYAGRQSALFRIYTQNRYEKINSRIDIQDLQSYAKTFHPDLGLKFKSKLKETSEYYLRRASVDIKSSYGQILQWRHIFAHTGARVTTVEEVLRHHGLAKRVLFAFADSFREFP
jgi:hypothetical protein